MEKCSRCTYRKTTEINPRKKEKKSKTTYIIKHKRQEYLTKLDPKEAKSIIRIRLKMIDLAKYMKNKYNNTKCRLCKKESEDLKHFLTCEMNLIRKTEEESQDIIRDIKSEEIHNIVHATKEINNTMEYRKTLLALH